MGFFTDIIKKTTIGTVTTRVLKELGSSLTLYQQQNPKMPITAILKDKLFYKTINVRDERGKLAGNAEHIIKPLTEDIKHRENDPVYLIIHIVTGIVIHELSYDQTIGERTDFEMILNTINKNLNKYIRL